MLKAWLCPSSPRIWMFLLSRNINSCYSFVNIGKEMYLLLDLSKFLYNQMPALHAVNASMNAAPLLCFFSLQLQNILSTLNTFFLYRSSRHPFYLTRHILLPLKSYSLCLYTCSKSLQPIVWVRVKNWVR